MNDYPFAKKWQFWNLMKWFSAVLLLFGVWIWPVTRVFWNHLDMLCFKALNTTVSWGYPFAAYWAFTGNSRFDLVVAVLILTFFLFDISRQGKQSFLRGIVLGCLTALVLLMVIGVQREVVAWKRESPSLVVDSRYSIKEIVPWSKAKESSKTSFPSDHGTVMMIFMFLWVPVFGRRMGYGLGVFMLIACLPRLVAGAHWLTDTIVGGASVAMFTRALFEGLPFGWWGYQKIYPWVEKIEQKWIKLQR